DSSDNIPGARGIGPKTALQLIEAYGAVEDVLAHADEVPNKRARQALKEYADDVRLSKELVTIRRDLPIELDMEALAVKEPDRDRLREVFLELEFHSLVRDYAAPEPAAERVAAEYRLVETAAEAAELAERARRERRVSLDTEATSLDPIRADLVGMSLAFAPGEAYYLPFAHRRPGELELDDRRLFNLPPLGSPEMRPLVAMLEDPAVAKVGQNLKYDLLVLRRAGVTLRRIAFDTMIASYVLDPGRREHGADSLALQYLDHRTMTYEELCGMGKNEIPFAEVALDRARDYACEDADIALRLARPFAEDLERYALADLFRRIEMPLVQVLAEMEWAGIRIDPAFFEELSRRLTRELGLIEEDIYKEAGGEFNINSTPQLRTVLFEKLELPVVRRTKTGPSTDASV